MPRTRNAVHVVEADERHSQHFGEELDLALHVLGHHREVVDPGRTRHVTASITGCGPT